MQSGVCGLLGFRIQGLPAPDGLECAWLEHTMALQTRHDPLPGSGYGLTIEHVTEEKISVFLEHGLEPRWIVQEAVGDDQLVHDGNHSRCSL